MFATELSGLNREGADPHGSRISAVEGRERPNGVEGETAIGVMVGTLGTFEGGGLAIGIVALVADSFHMLNDVLSLVVALYAIKTIAQFLPSGITPALEISNGSARLLLLIVTSTLQDTYLCIAGSSVGEVLLFDLFKFLSTAIIKRWTPSVVTYHTHGGGLFVGFSHEDSLERFERQYDGLLLLPHSLSGGPTLQQLHNLGIVHLPRIIGAFLVADVSTSENHPSPEHFNPMNNTADGINNAAANISENYPLPDHHLDLVNDTTDECIDNDIEELADMLSDLECEGWSDEDCE